jgi:RNA polymerase sigma factor (sigma-70 family)
VSDYKYQALKELADQQVRFAPPQRRLEQLKRAERLLAEIDLDREYPYQFICYRLTEYRPDAYPELLVQGPALLHDLGQLIAELAGSLPAIPADTLTEPVRTLEEISKQLNVTTKTINRWRKRGLIGIPVLVNGRRHVGFIDSLVEPFLATNRDRVARSGKFSQLSQEEKDEILRRARRFARLGVGSLTQVSRRIARRLGRSPETVRYTIKNYDQEHPHEALFPALTGPFDSATKQLIFNSYRRGITVETLAKNFQRTRSSMYRVLNEIRAQRLLDHPIEYLPNETFDNPALDDEFLAPMPDLEEFEAARRALKIPKDAPAELAACYTMPLLSKPQEQHLFRKMNYLKYKAAKLLAGMKTLAGRINTQKVRTQDLDEIDQCLARANEIKDVLIRCNMRLVVSIAKRHSGQTDNFFELLSDGNMSLMRAVEKFDYSRGNKFSTYASWAIMKNYARSIPDEKTRRERYITGNEELFDAAPDQRTDEQEVVQAAEQATHKVNRLLDYLDPREREIIRLRAGLDSNEGMTLEKIGEKLGITKERVRQLNVRAMKKLRGLVEKQRDEM